MRISLKKAIFAVLIGVSSANLFAAKEYPKIVNNGHEINEVPEIIIRYLNDQSTYEETTITDYRIHLNKRKKQIIDNTSPESDDLIYDFSFLIIELIDCNCAPSIINSILECEAQSKLSDPEKLDNKEMGTLDEQSGEV